MRLACVEGVSKKARDVLLNPRRAPSRGKERKGNGCYAGYNEVERKVRDKWKLLTLNMRWTLFAQVFSLLKINSGHNYTFCEFLFSMSFSLDRGPPEQRTCAWHRDLKAWWHFWSEGFRRQISTTFFRVFAGECNKVTFIYQPSVM